MFVTSNMKKIDAVILAGGLGTRLRSVVNNRPKVLAEVNGRPFITFLLDRLRSAGVEKVILCIGYLGWQVKSLLGDFYREMELIYSVEDTPLGTGGALRLALPAIRSEDVLVMNGDSFYTAELPAFYHQHKILFANASILLTKVTNMRRYGSIKTDRDGRIICFKEKSAEKGPGLINTGIYLIKREMIATIRREVSLSLEKDIFPAWINRGLFGVPSEGEFIDIGTPASYRQAESFFSQVA